MSVCYLNTRTGQIRTREDSLKAIGVTPQIIQFQLNSGLIKQVACPTEPVNGVIPPTPPPSPALGFDFSLRDMLLVLVALKLSKTPQGLQVLKELGKSFFKMIGDALDSLGKASAANPVTAWANPYLISIVLERFGMVASERMLEFRLGLSLISGATVAEGFADTIHGIIPFAAHDPSDFPSEVHLGNKTFVTGFRPFFREVKPEKKKGK